MVLWYSMAKLMGFDTHLELLRHIVIWSHQIVKNVTLWEEKRTILVALPRWGMHAIHYRHDTYQRTATSDFGHAVSLQPGVSGCPAAG